MENKIDNDTWVYVIVQNPDTGNNQLAGFVDKDSKEQLVPTFSEKNEALGWMYSAEGLHNLLVLSGDYPIDGYDGIAQPVFDLDSVGLLKMLTDMNNGLEVAGRKPGTTVKIDKTDFFLGCTVSPFKLTEQEQMMQYQKFRAKVKAGAHFDGPQQAPVLAQKHDPGRGRNHQSQG